MEIGFSEGSMKECVNMLLYCRGGVHFIWINAPKRCAWVGWIDGWVGWGGIHCNCRLIMSCKVWILVSTVVWSITSVRMALARVYTHARSCNNNNNNNEWAIGATEQDANWILLPMGATFNVCAIAELLHFTLTNGSSCTCMESDLWDFWNVWKWRRQKGRQRPRQRGAR